MPAGLRRGLAGACSAVSVLCASALLLASALYAVALDLEAVALVASLEGKARFARPGDPTLRSLALFDRLPAGTRVETGDRATLLLVYRSGARVRLAPGSAATVTDRDVTLERGRVERLPAVPPVPAFDPPAADLRRPGVAAVRIRATEIGGLYPSGGASTIADATALAFAAEGGHGTYAITVEDAQGRIVMTTRTTGSPLRVPPGTLEPGRAYRWRVSARTAAGTVLRGEADFTTVSAAQAAWRADARRLVPAGDATAWLAEIDLALGLWREAQDGFLAAAGLPHADEEVIRHRLEALAGLVGPAPER